MHAVTKVEPRVIASVRFNQDQVELIKSTICPGATDDELRLFLYHADKTGLDPLARQIYSVERKQQRNGNWVTVRSIQTSIDGFRLIAQRSGEYEGQVGPFWCGDDGQWVDVWLHKKAPSAARVGVMRKNFRDPCWGVARYDAYAQKKNNEPTHMWAAMPDVMLAKCAESLALRKAFPQELSGLYTGDEMQQADEVVERPKLTPPPAPKTTLTPEEEAALDRQAIRNGMGETPDRAPYEEEPHTITTAAKSDREWGIELVGKYKASADLGTLMAWHEANEKIIDQLGPKAIQSLKAAYDARYAEIVATMGPPETPLEELVP